MMGRKPLALPLALLVLAGVPLAGCGGGSSSSSSGSLITPGAPVQHTTSSAQAVAYVSGTPIPKASYQHWLGIEHAMGTAGNASHQALGFLITTSWVLGEAAARHIAVPEAEVRKRLQEVEKQAFHKSSELEKFMSKSHETNEDLLARVRVELLQKRIAAQVAQRKATLAGFQRNFAAHWKRLTDCLPAYVMEDCKQYKGAPEQLSSGSSSGSASASRGRSRSSSSSASSSSGEVYTPPGAFSVSSPAFERNGAIPVQYTCDGSGSSPPLSWEKVPAHAAELFLFVIDTSSSSSHGGIRWVVGGIDPSSNGVAAGKLPPGGIVGTNTAGKAAYGPICPDRGHTDNVEIVMYALRKKISISPGFQPSLAEHEYGSTKDLMGSAAVTYAAYHRA